MPQSGTYLVSFYIVTTRAYAYVMARLVIDGKHIVDATADSAGLKYEIMGSNTAILSLTVGESIWVDVMKTGSAGGDIYGSQSYRETTLSGILLL